MDKIIKATDGKEYLVTAKEYDLSMTMAEMLRDYTDGVQENALRLAQYRDSIRAEARAEALKEAAKRAVDFCSSWNINSDWLRSVILADEPKEEDR